MATSVVEVVSTGQAVAFADFDMSGLKYVHPSRKHKPYKHEPKEFTHRVWAVFGRYKGLVGWLLPA